MKNFALEDVLEGRVGKIRSSHFLPDEVVYGEGGGIDFGPGTFLCSVTASGEEEGETSEFRLNLQRSFLFPTDRPLFRAGNAYDFADAAAKTPYLRNVHLGLSKPFPNVSTTDLSIGIVQGNYLYHHYLQDRASDDGWGCAYRSLQTIVSWFRLQVNIVSFVFIVFVVFFGLLLLSLLLPFMLVLAFFFAVVVVVCYFFVCGFLSCFCLCRCFLFVVVVVFVMVACSQHGLCLEKFLLGL